ncbi:MAG: hypothetical protein EOO13_15915 [Chitinophagaceae bacterium]|nr:MAG: hypothetical protein EOO13_15915 [Chitinophagaceae bacterium]
MRSVLSFAQSNKEIILTPDIEKFRELKIRLLNGSHTFTCGIALLAGFNTVKEAMANEAFAHFINKLMKEEITDAIQSNSINRSEAIDFSGKVLDRYRNPFIEHQWLSICMNYSSKMHMRNVPLFYAYHQKKSTVPALMSLGMAGHILFMRSREQDGYFYGKVNEMDYKISDSNAAWYQQAWEQEGAAKIVETVLANKSIWQSDLNEIKGFSHEVNYWLQQLLTHGAQATLENVQTKISI